MLKSSRMSGKEIVEAIIIGFILAVLSLFIYQIGKSSDFFFYNSEDGITIKRTIELFQLYKKSEFLMGLFSGWIVFSFVYLLFVKMDYKYRKMLYRYRYILALILLALCVVLEISGSSISSFASALGVDPDAAGVLFRTANPYRSDEYGLNTLFAVAQEKNTGNPYSYLSDIVRGTSTDMYIVYGQPVRDIGIIFRPFQLGYIIFGSSKGLSFFWCGRLIFLALCSFEFARIFLNRRKIYAVIYAVFIAASPVVQWWFAINGFVEMLLFGQLCAIVLYLFINTNSRWKRVLYSFCFFWSGCVYVLLFYPAWQVVFGYVYLGIFIWIIIENRTKFSWDWKKDIYTVIIPAIIVGSILLFVVFRSWDTISAVLNTVYPGNRIDLSKLHLSDLFGGMYNLYLALTDSHMFTVWGFIDLFPLGIAMAIYALFKKKVRDSFLMIMLIIDVVMIAVFTLPVPEIFIKVTLLSQTTANRALIAIQFINIILLFRSLQYMQFKWKKRSIIIIGGVFAGIVTIMFGTQIKEIPWSLWMKVGMFIACFVLCCLFCLSRFRRTGRWTLIVCICIFSIAGGLVNPLQKGLEFISESRLISEIESIVDEDEKAKWITVDMSYPDTNIPLLAGASTINSTNVYPTLDRWKKLDPSGKYEDVYNRYAHIVIQLKKNKQTKFKLLAPDRFQINLNIQDLEKLDVKYILSRQNLEGYSNDQVDIKTIRNFNNYYIYEVSYR